VVKNIVNAALNESTILIAQPFNQQPSLLMYSGLGYISRKQTLDNGVVVSKTHLLGGSRSK